MSRPPARRHRFAALVGVIGVSLMPLTFLAGPAVAEPSPIVPTMPQPAPQNPQQAPHQTPSLPTPVMPSQPSSQPAEQHPSQQEQPQPVQPSQPVQQKPAPIKTPDPTPVQQPSPQATQQKQAPPKQPDPSPPVTPSPTPSVPDKQQQGPQDRGGQAGKPPANQQGGQQPGDHQGNGNGSGPGQQPTDQGSSPNDHNGDHQQGTNPPPNTGNGGSDGDHHGSPPPADNGGQQPNQGNGNKPPQPGNNDGNHQGQPGSQPGQQGGQGNGSGKHDGPPPLKLPPPTSNPFPDWGHKPPVDVHPTPVPGDHKPPQPNGHDGHNGPPPPVLGDHHVYDPWQHGNRQQPPPNPNIFVGPGNNNQVVIVNNITTINNTVINNAPATLYLTNFVTNQVVSVPVNYGTPYALAPGWCGGVGGSWGWSANVAVPGFGASFAGGGVLNVNGSCGYVPPPPVQSTWIYASGYTPVPINDYVAVAPDCIYVDNTYLYGSYQQQVVEGQSQQVFVPTSYTPDIVFQQPTQGLPPFITGDNPAASSSNWFAQQPVILWVGVGIVVFGLLALAYVNRQHLLPGNRG